MNPYTIQKDEKISDIMDRFDVPYHLIWRFNRFVESKEHVYEGRTLSMPRVHVALPGDSYQSIGDRYGIIPSYLKELNPYMDDQSVIYPGQTIFLPPT